MTLATIREWVANDGLAISFQSMGQYRTALLRAIDETADPSLPAGDGLTDEQIFSLWKEWCGFGGLLRDILGYTRAAIALATLRQPGEVGAGVPKLKVFYGPMPESNGKSNFTAILYRDNGNDVLDIVDGVTLEVSEYPDRVRYEADRARFLIGELTERPDVLAYDAVKHSGYVESAAASAQQDERADWLTTLIMECAPLVGVEAKKSCPEEVIGLIRKAIKPAQQDEREALIDVLKIEQNNLASSRERCDPDWERPRWDALQRVIDYLATIQQAQADAQQDEREAFEAWYTQNAFDYERNPVGSRECGLQWKAWQARAAQQVQTDAGAVAIPVGWILVPVDPTDDMLRAPDAGKLLPASVSKQMERWDRRRAEFSAMIGAAPGAPDTDPDTRKATHDSDAVDIEELRRTVEEFDESGETSTDYATLMAWENLGLLECSHFTIMKKARELIEVRAAMSREQSQEKGGE